MGGGNGGAMKYSVCVGRRGEGRGIDGGLRERSSEPDSLIIMEVAMQFSRQAKFKRLSVAALIGVLAFLAACTQPQPGSKPVAIEKLAAVPGAIAVGGESTIEWVVTGDHSSIKLMAGATLVKDSLPATGSEVVKPTVTTEYTLVVRNLKGQEVKKSVTVTVEPTAVTIVKLDATPSSIVSGGESTIEWVVTGDHSSIKLMAGATLVKDSLPATGSEVVKPTVTTEYTLVVHDLGGHDVTDSVTVTVGPVVVAPTMNSVDAELAIGSQFMVTWSATGAASFDVVAVDAPDGTDVVPIPGGADISGTETTATLPIPDSGHQFIRVVAKNSAGTASMDTTAALENVVLNAQDYDPYDPAGGAGEAAIPGSFRQVLSAAPADSIIGFAADVVAAGTIHLPGVLLGTWGDAHIYVNKNVRISGPASGLTLQGESGHEPGDPGTAFSWNSRVLYVGPSANVTLDNLTLTGGTFIFAGAGVRNFGNLTMNGGAVTGNRAWYTGGGIQNAGTLVLNGTDVSDNTAATIDGEVGANFEIRGNPAYTTGTINVGGWGGGIYNEATGTVTLNDASVTDNAVRFSGGGISNDKGTVTVSGGSVDSNEATDASYAGGNQGRSVGGGIYTEGAITLTSVQVDANDALNIGGGLAARTPATAGVTTSTFSNNSADYGGGIFVWYCGTGAVEDVLTLDGVTTFSGNVGRISGNDQGSEAVVCTTAARLGAASSSPFLPSAEQLEEGMRR